MWLRPAGIAATYGSHGLGRETGDALKFTKATVVWAARFEVTRTVEDVLARWVRVLFLDAIAVI